MSDFDPTVQGGMGSVAYAGNADPLGSMSNQEMQAGALNVAAKFGPSGIGSLMSAISGGPLPQADPSIAAPKYSLAGFGTASMDPALRDTLTAGNAGSLVQGITAFLGTNPDTQQTQNSELGGDVAYQPDQYSTDARTLATRAGLDPSVYPNTQEGNAQLQSALNTKLGNYYAVSGMSSGWDGSSGNPRAAATTMYQNVNGELIPTSGPFNYSAPTSSSINRNVNMDAVTAASIMAPAFGGLGGVLGAGAEGTLTAGGGLGLTTGVADTIGVGATNALTGALQSYLTSGGQGGIQGILSSLGGSALNAGANSLMGNSGGLGSMFDTAGADSIGSTYNPVKGMSSLMNGLGLGPLSGAAGLFSGFAGNGINSDSLRGIAGEVAGGYAGSQINPKLRGLGATAGRDVVMNLLPA
jgi:hypothetical protein